jgi:hypothetical protein
MKTSRLTRCCKGCGSGENWNAKTRSCSWKLVVNNMRSFLTLTFIYCFSFTVGVSQNSLPYPIIPTEQFEIDSSKYAVFPYPTLPSFVGIPSLDTEYQSHDCRPYYDLIKQKSWQESLRNASTYLPDLALQDGFPISVNFVVCGWGNVLPHGDNRESYYLFAIFGESDKKESLMLYAYNYSQWGGGNAIPTAIINKIEIADDDWKQIASNTYSFTQTITQVSNSSEHTITKFFNLLTALFTIYH